MADLPVNNQILSRIQRYLGFSTSGSSLAHLSVESFFKKTNPQSVSTLPLPPISFTLTRSVASVNEGETVTFFMNTVSVANGTTVPYTITGISTSDIGGASLTGNFTINNGTASATFSITADASTEGVETMVMTSANQTVSVTINDTSTTPPTYTLSRAQANVNEGGQIQFSMVTTNVPNGTLVPYTITGITSNDIDGEPLVGNFEINNQQDHIVFNITADSITEGVETMTMTSAGQTVSVIINDTSTAISNTGTWSLETKIDGIDSGDLLGYRVDINAQGNIVLISAPSYNMTTPIMGYDCGEITIYKKNAGVWSQLGQTLYGNNESGSTAGANAGTSVAIDDTEPGTHIVYGMPNAIATGVPIYGTVATGGVRTYTLGGNTWSPYGELPNENGTWGTHTDAQFGTSVDINSNGTVMVVSEYGYQSNLSNPPVGKVTVFSLNGSNWVQRGTPFIGVDGNAGRIGSCVSLSKNGNRVAIGYPKFLPSGKIVVYDWNGSSWVQLGADITTSSSNITQSIGDDFALNANGTRIVVRRTVNGAGAQSNVYIFQWSGTAWTQMGSAIAQGGTNGGGYGSVAINGLGNTVAIGSPLTGVTSIGRVLVYNWTGSDWVQRGDTIQGEDKTYGDTVAINDAGDVVVAGSTNDPNPGYVTIHRFTPVATPTYTLTRSTASVNEGSTVTFTMTTTNVANGTAVPYTITGVSTSDIDGASLTGNFTINSNTASVTLNITSDTLTEGTETITMASGGQTISVTINDTSTAPVLRPLFDRSTFTLVPEPYRSHLNAAATRFETYIKIPDATWDLIKAARSGAEDWKGMRLVEYTERNYGVGHPNRGMIAACGPRNVYDLVQPGSSGLKFQASGFALEINKYWETAIPSGASTPYEAADWIAILTHELGHGIGIGTFWQSFLQAYGAVPPVDFFLSNVYTNAQQGYNIITGNTYTKMPLEDAGGAGTAAAHWEMDFRPGTALGANGTSYPGVTNELMIGYYTKGMALKISKLSIGALKDFGYEEVNPGTDEGNPTLDTSLMAALNAGDDCHKLCCHRSMELADKACIGTIVLPSLSA
jgi:hypothetical protein